MTIDLLSQVKTAAGRAGVILDVDGTLARIVPRPEDARVPPETRAELERLAARYALVACLSGRTSEDARRIVGVDGIEYVGVHGLELEPEAERWRERLRRFAASVEWPAEDVEDKGLVVSFHFRSAEDEAAARAALGKVGEDAACNGLIPRFGRKVLEIRPPVKADKGTAVRHLLAGRELKAGLYAGDDATDRDAFRGLAAAGLVLAVRVAVLSEEAPPELAEEADISVNGPEGMLDLLRQL